MANLSRRPILLAILLCERFIHLIRINSRPIIQFLSTQQRAHKSVLVTSLFDSVCVTLTGWVNFLEKNIYMNMNYSYLTTMYESIFTRMYTILVEKYFFAIFA